VGLDVAFGALAQARHRLQAEGVTGSFVLAEAPVLPFRSSAFALVFDRGCLQAIPREGWPTYFREVARVLRGGGVLQLFCSKPTKRFPPLLSYRGVRARLRWFLGRRGPQFLSHDLLQRLAEPSLRPVVLEDLPMQLSTGPPRVMTHAIFEKNGQESPNVDPMPPRP
jgi:ubiquinone/menaquinone biosynthesis C-methylase UbiE